MTFGTYIRTIKKVVKVSGDQREMVANLFTVAGTLFPPGEDTVDSWIKNKNKYNGSNYFQNGINDSDVIMYFKGLIPSTWSYVRDEFMRMSTDSIISFDTEIPDVFFDRLLDQFYDVLGMQRLRVSFYVTSSLRIKRYSEERLN